MAVETLGKLEAATLAQRGCDRHQLDDQLYVRRAAVETLGKLEAATPPARGRVVVSTTRFVCA